MGVLLLLKRVCRVSVMMRSRVSLSSCVVGVKPAIVIVCRQSAMVRGSGLAVYTEQLLQQRRVPRQYLIIISPVLLSVRRFEQTMHLVHEMSRSAMMVVMRLCRLRVVHGAHQFSCLCVIHEDPLLSNEPQLTQLGGGGSGM